AAGAAAAAGGGGSASAPLRAAAGATVSPSASSGHKYFRVRINGTPRSVRWAGRGAGASRQGVRRGARFIANKGRRAETKLRAREFRARRRIIAGQKAGVFETIQLTTARHQVTSQPQSSFATTARLRLPAS